MRIMSYELNNTVNDNRRKGDYSCSQSVHGRLPRRADGSQMDTEHVADLGIVSE